MLATLLLAPALFIHQSAHSEAVSMQDATLIINGTLRDSKNTQVQMGLDVHFEDIDGLQHGDNGVVVLKQRPTRDELDDISFTGWSNSGVDLRRIDMKKSFPFVELIAPDWRPEFFSRSLHPGQDP